MHLVIAARARRMSRTARHPPHSVQRHVCVLPQLDDGAFSRGPVVVGTAPDRKDDARRAQYTARDMRLAQDGRVLPAPEEIRY
jgi:hypothetical protein